MIGRTLFSYLLRHYLATTMKFMLGILVLVFLIKLSEFAGRYADLPQFSYAAAVQVSLLNVLVLSLQILPFVALFGAMAHFVALNGRSELTIARAAGVSAWQFLVPALVGSALIGVVSTLLVNPIAVRSNALVGEIELQINGRTEGSATKMIWLRQNSADRTLIIGGLASDARPTELRNATILRIDNDGQVVSRTDAARGTLRDGSLHLVDVVERGDGPIDRRAEATIDTNLSTEALTTRFSDPDSVSIYDLPGQIRVSEELGNPPYALQTRLQLLLAQPFFLMVMTVIAATVSLRFSRLGISARLVFGGVGVGFLLYVTTILVEALGRVGAVPPVVAAWSPVLVGAFVGVDYLLRREDG